MTDEEQDAEENARRGIRWLIVSIVACIVIAAAAWSYEVMTR
jgi:flagellar basal body-associated protein FliL